MLVGLFALTTLVSAFLLFWVQPLVAKMLLPLLGGTPAVWNTAMMFFQLLLLGGYLYVHLLRKARFGVQVGVHLAVLAAGLATLPFRVAEGLAPPTGGMPIGWLLGTFAVMAGLPFFGLSATAPLIQAWFGRSGDRRAGDPYFLYAASNVGSFAALLGFPFVLEPWLSLGGQAGAWAGGFALLALLIASCAALLGRRLQPAPVAANEAAPWPDRIGWTLLALVPSSLLLGVTSFVGTDIASVPLLWVVPLALYLATFILVFARPVPDRLAGMLIAGGVIAIVALLAGTRLLGLQAPIRLSLPVHILSFTAIALGCHAALANRRPAAARLTEFYLCMSGGGAIGGTFNALAAPLLFPSTFEYELGLVAAAMVPVFIRPRRPGSVVPDLAMALVLGVAFLGGSIALKSPDLRALGSIVPAAATLAGAALLLLAGSRPRRLALSAVVVLAAGLLARNVVDVLHEERSFFGVHRVRQLDGGLHRALIHGDIIHGVQSTETAEARRPLTYYSAEGPVGQMMAALPPPRRVGVIGLGTGAMACYARPGERWSFYEIDPAVVRLARDPRFFSFMQSCGDPPVILGDGRLTLAADPGGFDMLVLDAFSSDAIPVHLLTREAFALYAAKLAPGGRLAIHISNKYMDLRPVIAAQAEAIGATALIQTHTASPEEAARWITTSQWTLMSRDAAALAPLRQDTRWQDLRAFAGASPWTDNASNVLGVLKW